MRWTRKEKGEYISGNYTVTGKGTKWELFYDGEAVGGGTFSSKKLAQSAAESHEPAPRPSQVTKPLSDPDVVQQLRLDISTLLGVMMKLQHYVERLVKLLEEE
jgi:hypothetical protein